MRVMRFFKLIKFYDLFINIYLIEISGPSFEHSINQECSYMQRPTLRQHVSYCSDGSAVRSQEPLDQLLVDAALEMKGMRGL